MIDRTSATAGLSRLDATQKSRLIYDEARSQMAGRLWRAALGATENADAPASTAAMPEEAHSIGLERLLSLLSTEDASPSPPSGATGENAVEKPGPAPAALRTVDVDGANARYTPMLNDAAARSGIPAPALAAIIDAEAAKGPGGAWQPYSRNPRSSAAGLGQFLNGTWEGEAERAGTWLNGRARENGWLDSDGRVRGDKRGALLALRYDPRASIEAVADYASANVQSLRKAGVPIESGVADIARAAYLGHHLGLGDARRFLAGGLAPDRARKLLGAQVGAAAAERRIAQAGGAVAAHRTWLLGYVGEHIRPERFG